MSRRTSSPLRAAYAGLSLLANTHVDADDREDRERLIKYILRPVVDARRSRDPLAPSAKPPGPHTPAGRALVALLQNSICDDGTWAVEMDELSLVARLAALVPAPWQNQVRYSGVLAPASQRRSRIVPQPQ